MSRIIWKKVKQMKCGQLRCWPVWLKIAQFSESPNTNATLFSFCSRIIDLVYFL